MDLPLEYNSQDALEEALINKEVDGIMAHYCSAKIDVKNNQVVQGNEPPRHSVGISVKMSLWEEAEEEQGEWEEEEEVEEEQLEIPKTEREAFLNCLKSKITELQRKQQKNRSIPNNQPKKQKNRDQQKSPAGCIEKFRGRKTPQHYTLLITWLIIYSSVAALALLLLLGTIYNRLNSWSPTEPGN